MHNILKRRGVLKILSNNQDEKSHYLFPQKFPGQKSDQVTNTYFKVVVRRFSI